MLQHVNVEMYPAFGGPVG